MYVLIVNVSLDDIPQNHFSWFRVLFRKVASAASKPRSWFGPNGQYIRELPCPSCRGRGYTPCTECGIERSRPDCSLCNGKVKVLYLLF